MTYFRPQIERMQGYQPGEQPKRTDIIKLNTNENPYDPSPLAIEAIQRAASQSLRRYPDPMASEFREAAAEVFGLEPDWFLCGNGSDELLTILVRAFVGEGQVLRYPYPSYILYKTLAEIQGAQFQQVMFKPDWSLPEAFASADGKPRLVFLANPNSPSGTLVEPEVVLEIARRLPCPLVVDEAYVDFAATNCLHLVRECEKVIVTRTLSKSYALAGLRFGFLVAQPHIVSHLVKVKDSYNCDALSIAGATAAIRDQQWLRDTTARIIATRTRLYQEMLKLGFEVVASEANFTWNTHPEVPARLIYERLKQEGILVRYMDYPDWGDGLRITVGTDEQIDVLLEQIRKLL